MTNITDIDYEELVQNALRDVIKQSLKITASQGPVGDHHFYISFATDFPGVVLPQYLREEYPEEITVVLQHEFWDLTVEDNFFKVTLCFNDMNEPLTVPFEAITNFVDPSVKFGLQFTPNYDLALEEPAPVAPPKKGKKAADKNKKKTKGDDSNVVTLDAFRKK
jgi:hypothetical protein